MFNVKQMPGYPADKFKNLKTAYTFMFGHPVEIIVMDRISDNFRNGQKQEVLTGIYWKNLNIKIYMNMLKNYYIYTKNILQCILKQKDTMHLNG